MTSVLPRSWQWKPLRDLTTINYGKSASAILSEDGGIPVVGTGGAERYGSDYLYDGESIILGRKGTIDKVGFVGGKFWTIDTAFFLSDFFDDTCVRWLYYFLQNIDLRSLNEATGVPSLSRELLYKINVPTPPGKEQLKIAEILSTLDRAIEQTESLIAKQRRINTGLMQDLLTKGIDEHGNIRSEATHAFKDSTLGRIPVGWDVQEIKSLLADVDPSMRSGPFGSALLKEELSDSGVPLLGIDNVFPEKFLAEYKRFVPPKKAKQLHRYLVRPRDLMITIMGTVGRCCLVPDEIGEALSSKHVWTISIDQAKYSPYVASLQINHAPWVLEHFARDEQGGIMASIRAETLRTTKLPVPPHDELEKIESVLRAISSDLCEKELLITKLSSLKAGLMQDLLTGKVRVTQLLASQTSQE